MHSNFRLLGSKKYKGQIAKDIFLLKHANEKLLLATVLESLLNFKGWKSITGFSYNFLFAVVARIGLYWVSE